MGYIILANASMKLAAKRLPKLAYMDTSACAYVFNFAIDLGFVTTPRVLQVITMCLINPRRMREGLQ